MRKDGQPPLFVLDERRRCRAAGQANSEILAQTERPVVPPLDGLHKRKAGEIRMLFLQQRLDQSNIDCHFRLRRVWVRRHCSTD
jgi:hypothetical protein